MRNLYHIPVTQDHLDAGQSATWQNRVGNVAVIPHGQRVLSRAALNALLADHRLLDDGRQIHYYCRHDRIALMAACDAGRDAEVQPQTSGLRTSRPTMLTAPAGQVPIGAC